MKGSQSEILFHEILDTQTIFVGWTKFFFLALKGAGAFHSAGQIKEGYVGFGTSEHPIFMKLLPDHLWH